MTYDTFTSPLLAWYRANARILPWRETAEPYRVWLSEIMLQQTRVETVVPYYNRFLAALPTVRALADAEEARVFKLWEGLGYYSRARNLQKAARVVAEKYGGAFPRGLDALRALPGVGEYTAAAIASICFGAASPAVDGNVLRVVSRVTGDFTPVGAPGRRAEVAETLTPLFPESARGDFTQALMELGALVCLPGGAARCGDCPAADVCAAFRGGTAAELPVKTPKKERRTENLTVLLLTCGDKIAVRKRPGAGLLAGLWELPNFPGHHDPDSASALAESLGVRPAAIDGTRTRKHVFTHIEWRMTCYKIPCGAMPDSFVWASPAALRDELALPTAFSKVLAAFAR
jgi:A/G-specific adenine glycosylase